VNRSRIIHRAPRSQHGFTLVELLVVMGVILLLVALVLTVGTSLVRQSEVRETENVIKMLDVAVQEWEVAAQQSVLFGINDEPCSFTERYQLDQLVGAGTIPTQQQARRITEQMWELFARNAEVRELLARISPSFLEEINADDETYLSSRSFRIRDAWGNPIIAVMPGRAFANRCPNGSAANEPYTRDRDGTIRTPYEVRYGVANDRRIFFVSAGPSGEFGNLHLDTARNALDEDELDEVRDAEDNIYSYPVQIEEARP
jgi:prepilin-type N-terminal cleavage/methylation domain-containing protein